MKERACFICKSTDGEYFNVEKWQITALGEIRIGFRICSGCGMVLQDPIVDPALMQLYYRESSNYTNAGRSGEPSRRKVRGVGRQMEFLQKYFKEKGTAFQVGCSDGYTLSRFLEIGWQVDGIDPSPAAARVAQEKYDLNPRVGFFEDFQSGKEYDLVLLTHILEHIYDPKSFLEKVVNLLDSSGRILIEIPVLEEPDQWPPGYFTFEHVNYFSETSLLNLLSLLNLCPASPCEIDLTGDIYPVIRCLAKLENKGGETELVSDFSFVQNVCHQYLAMERKIWKHIDGLLRSKLASIEKVVIWGAGIHTSQLLSCTRIENYSSIEFIVDSDAQKWGKKLGNYDVQSPDRIPWDDEKVALVISSYASEKEILKSTIGTVSQRIRIISLYT
jgi:SAM-dependent methyltransferase